MSIKREFSYSPDSSPKSPDNQPELEEENLKINEPKKPKIKGDVDSNSQENVKLLQNPKAKRAKKNTKSSKSWNEEQDKYLQTLVTGDQGGSKPTSPWRTIHQEFNKRYPDATKSMDSIKWRWRFQIRDGDTELADSEKILFKQAVSDIDGKERVLAYAWRFKELGGRDLNKNAAAKLYKLFKSGNFDPESAENEQYEEEME